MGDDILSQRVAPLKERYPRGVAPVYSVGEAREQSLFIEALMVQRPDLSQRAQERATKEKFAISRGRYCKLRAKVLDRWAREDEAQRPSWKAQAMRRLERWIQACEKSGNYRLVQKFHADLMDVQGVREPLKLDLHVEVQSTLVNVIMELTPAQVDDALREYQETQRLAGHARELGMGEAIDVAAE
jgi:hypothetical protein